MATFQGMARFAGHQRRRFAKKRRSLTVAHDALSEGMREEAVALTSGTAHIAAIDRTHPFSRRRPFGGVPRLPIQTRTGRLVRAWRVMRRGNAKLLVNLSPEGKFVLAPGGTRLMRARGFWTELRKRYLRRRARFERAALKD